MKFLLYSSIFLEFLYMWSLIDAKTAGYLASNYFSGSGSVDQKPSPLWTKYQNPQPKPVFTYEYETDSSPTTQELDYTDDTKYYQGPSKSWSNSYDVLESNPTFKKKPPVPVGFKSKKQPTGSLMSKPLSPSPMSKKQKKKSKKKSSKGKTRRRIQIHSSNEKDNFKFNSKNIKKILELAQTQLLEDEDLDETTEIVIPSTVIPESTLQNVNETTSFFLKFLSLLPSKVVSALEEQVEVEDSSSNQDEGSLENNELTSKEETTESSRLDPSTIDSITESAVSPTNDANTKTLDNLNFIVTALSSKIMDCLEGSNDADFNVE